MSRLSSSHLSFCIAEMAAELDSALSRDEHVQALAQLDEREARGEKLEAVCGIALRRHLEQEISSLPEMRARVKLAELAHALGAPLATAFETPAETSVETPVQTSVPAPVSTAIAEESETVVDFAAYQTRLADARARQEPSEALPGPARATPELLAPSTRRSGGLARSVTLLGALCLLFMVLPPPLASQGSWSLYELIAPTLTEMLPWRSGLFAGSP